MAKKKNDLVQTAEEQLPGNERADVQNEEAVSDEDIGCEETENDSEDTADQGEDGDFGEDEEQESVIGMEEGSDQEDFGDAPRVLKALFPILYLSHQYMVGEVLPANDPEMVEAWVGAGTAAWVPVQHSAAAARPRTAQQGLPGRAVLSESEDGDDLVGRVPRTQARKRHV